MTAITIQNPVITTPGVSFTLKGKGDPDRKFIVCVSGTGQMLGQGQIDAQGNFSILIEPGSTNEYDIVLRYLEEDGSVGDNRDWSRAFKNPIKP
ncbi:hypothetical protein [Pseudomonas sp. S1_E04]